MADHAGQEHVRDRREDDEPAGDVDGAAASAQQAAQERDAEVDALLEEIDDVLESNAEQFVRGFVQKGGQ
ncbi:MAG TPA: ubiquitin-like protein Pup [Cellulomonas sp.]